MGSFRQTGADVSGVRLSEPVEGVWWLCPLWLMVFFIIPLYGLVYLIGDLNSKELTIRGLRFLDFGYLMLGLSMLLMMSLGAWLGGLLKFERNTEYMDGRWEGALLTIGLMCVCAYVFWFKEIFFSPATLLKIFTGGGRPSRTDIGAVKGVTSIVSFLPVYFSLVAHIWTSYPERMTRRLRALTWVLVGLTIFRVYIWSERLALIELMCSVALPITFYVQNRVHHKAIKRLLPVLPFLAIPVLLLYFGVFEFFRSWQSNFYNGKSEFWGFAAGRLGTYYYTALNNGAGLLATSNWPTYQFEHTLSWLHKAPAGLGRIFDYYTNFQSSGSGVFLSTYGDPEFNNPSGIFTVIVDMGLAPALLYFFLFGFVAGALYRAYAYGRVVAVVIYPIFFIALLEVMRIPYLGASRAFTAVLGAGFALLIIRSGRSRKAVLSHA